MLRALRRVRARLLVEGQTGRYLLYAFGELILVVIGILIALQLNTANEARIEQQEVRQYAQALVEDLKADQAMLQPILREMEDVRERVMRLSRYVQERPIEEMRNIDLFFLMRAPYYRPYQWNRAALEQMKSSGALRQMENRELAAMISAYDALRRHLEDDWVHDREIGVRALALANRVVNMNYPSMEDLVPPTQLRLGEQVLASGDELENSLVHKAFAELDLPMLRRDPVLLGEAVNAYQQIVDEYGLWPRFRVAMPMLQERIQELIDALEAEYPKWPVTAPPAEPGGSQTRLTPGEFRKRVLRASSVTESARLRMVARARPRNSSAASASPSCAASSARELKIFHPIVGQGWAVRIPMASSRQVRDVSTSSSNRAISARVFRAHARYFRSPWTRAAASLASAYSRAASRSPCRIQYRANAAFNRMLYRQRYQISSSKIDSAFCRCSLARAGSSRSM
jgi:hypothetical protein